MRSAMEGNGDEEAELAVGSQFLFKTYLSDRINFLPLPLPTYCNSPGTE